MTPTGESGGAQLTPRMGARERALFDSASDVFDHPTLEGERQWARSDPNRTSRGFLAVATDPVGCVLVRVCQPTR